MRTYITPLKLDKYDDNIPDLCIKCIEEKGTLFHCMWQCSKVKAFWEENEKNNRKDYLKRSCNKLSFLHFRIPSQKSQTHQQ